MASANAQASSKEFGVPVANDVAPTTIEINGKGAAARVQKVFDAIKYDPDQPRHERERWTEAGGGGGSQEEPQAGVGGARLRSVTPKEFVAARDASSRKEFLSSSTPDELKDHTLLLNHDGTVGVAISPDGDIQNLFNNGKVRGEASGACLKQSNGAGVRWIVMTGILMIITPSLALSKPGG